MFKDKKRLRVEQHILPSGCEGRIGTSIELEGDRVNNRIDSYRIVTKLGCAGLENGVVNVRDARYARAAYNPGPINRERKGFEIDAVRESGAQVIAACATCPLGSQGMKRETAQLMRAGSDELDLRLQIATEENSAAQARLQAAHLEAQKGNITS